MKRSAALTELSRDHHPALVLAKRIAQAPAPERQALCAGLSVLFARELAPHFTREETHLLPRLADAGHDALVARTLNEHRQMHDLAAAAGKGDEAALLAFGRLLQAHVRFEERELFAAAEAALDPAWLAAAP